MIIQKFISYINIFAKKDPNKKEDLNLRFMHGINRISIFMFLFALIVIVVRYVTKHY